MGCRLVLRDQESTSRFFTALKKRFEDLLLDFLRQLLQILGLQVAAEDLVGLDDHAAGLLVRDSHQGDFESLRRVVFVDADDFDDVLVALYDRNERLL